MGRAVLFFGHRWPLSLSDGSAARVGRRGATEESRAQFNGMVVSFLTFCCSIFYAPFGLRRVLGVRLRDGASFSF